MRRVDLAHSEAFGGGRIRKDTGLPRSSGRHVPESARDASTWARKRSSFICHCCSAVLPKHCSISCRRTRGGVVFWCNNTAACCGTALLCALVADIGGAAAAAVCLLEQLAATRASSDAIQASRWGVDSRSRAPCSLTFPRRAWSHAKYTSPCLHMVVILFTIKKTKHKLARVRKLL